MVRLMEDGQCLKVIERSQVDGVLFDKLWERTGSIQKVMDSMEILMMFAQCLGMKFIPHHLMMAMNNYDHMYPYTMLINR